ncbi:MAG: Na(+)/H(+) antiporter subunit D [Chloroflexi bacterium]|nr:Na(+)/H(+) antiporter subunit D [Chloroflexota bacterium]MBM4450174.1 Na(+)/H(+) antiporter subunit D [Chloroflexota bacterium]
MISLPPATILFLGAVLLPLLPRRMRSAALLVFPALTFFWLIYLNPGDNLSVHFLDYNLVVTRVDQLSLCFGYVFALITFLGGIYSYHLRGTAEQVSTLLYAGSSLGVVFAGDLLTLVFFWEIMAVSSVYLIWARGTTLSRGAGFRYLIVHLFGGSMLLAGVLVQLTQTGSMLFTYMDGGLGAYLIMFGFCLNAAVPPLHAWLSDAYPEGTVTGSVYLSAFTTKTAVYALARGFAGWDILVWAGAAMAVYGVIYAVLENDARRLLAYHIISQVGYMVCAVGIGTATAINGATAHAFAHILYKALLFMGVGTVLYATGQSKLTNLGGLARAMPLALTFYMVGALSISGFPLFSGFVSKSLVVHAAGLNHMGLVVLLLNLASVGTFLSTTLKLPYFIWFGHKNSAQPSAIPLGMYLGMALTAISCIAIGVYPSLLYNILPFPVDYQPYTVRHVIETSQLLIFTGLGFWLLIQQMGVKALISLDFDWFYRKPAQLAYKVCVVSVSKLFGTVEHAALSLTRFLVRGSANPIGYLVRAIPLVRQPKHHAVATDRQPHEYDPDRYRFATGVMVLLVLLIFIIVIAWSLFVS